MSYAKPCPVAGCSALIRTSASLCSEDWQRTPDYLQRAIIGMDPTRAGAAAYREAIDYLNQRGPLTPHQREL